MSTTGLVMTVTDELLAELEEAAGNATQEEWQLLPGTSLSGPEIIANGESIAWVLNSEDDAVHIATANPATITALTAELRRLRAENAELAKDAGRWRKARDILTVDAIEYAQSDYIQFGLPASELESVRADIAIDAAMATQ